MIERPIFNTVTTKTTDDFKALVANIEAVPGYRRPQAFGIARVTRSAQNPDQTLMARFPVVNWSENFGSAAVMMMAAGLVNPHTSAIDDSLGNDEVVAGVDYISAQMMSHAFSAFNLIPDEVNGDKHLNIQAVNALMKQPVGRSPMHAHTFDFKIVLLFGDAKPQSVEAAYLKLYALSHRKVEPNGLVTDGIFGVLPNVGWTVDGRPIELEDARQSYILDQLSNTTEGFSAQDKFPRMLDHVRADANVRILDSSKVRLGAYVSPGTTVMPGASYINFNAGTLGKAMVEGRISAGVVIGDGTDIGGGASTIGTLSGGGTIKISIGQNCLLGANSVTGIALGDGCIVDAGVTVTPGAVVTIDNTQLELLRQVNPNAAAIPVLATALSAHTPFVEAKAVDFMSRSGPHTNGVHFRVDSRTGTLRAMRSRVQIKLNDALHA